MKHGTITAFCISIVLFAACTAICLFNFTILSGPLFQAETYKIHFDGPSAAIYEKDGSLYVIDGGSFRLIRMSPDGQASYIITIDKFKEYTRIMDLAVDEEKNLYIYAMETEYDAYLTKRDLVRKYDSSGRYVKDILVIDYEAGNLSSDENPRTSPQIGSMRCENGVLSFSRILKDHVELYRYDVYRDEIERAVFTDAGGTGSDAFPHNFSVAQLALKDFGNFIYTTRNGKIYEVKNNSIPVLRASFEFNEKNGGIIPWYLDYRGENIVFFDMISGRIRETEPSGETRQALPGDFFSRLPGSPVLAQFGFYRDRFSGVFGDTVWYYDGTGFRTYEGGARLPPGERIVVTAVQVSLFIGILSFFFGIYIFFVKILNRYISLFIKQTAVIIPITIAALVFLYNLTSSFMTDRLNSEILNQLKAVAAAASMLLDGDEVDSLKSTADFDGETYRKILSQVKLVSGGNRNEWNKANYAAVYKVVDNFQYFLLQSNDEVNLFRPVGRIDRDTPEYDLITRGEIFAATYENMYGNWAYANVPVYNSGGTIIGIFEIGRDLTSYTIFNSMQRRTIIVTVALICVVIIVVLALIVSIIVRQLAGIAKVLGNIAKGDYSVRVHYKAKDELGKVSGGFNSMVEELQQQFEKINNLNKSSLRFVPVQFMEHLGVTDITRMKLGDNIQRNLTVLFFDIRSFSVNSEMMTARENFYFINNVMGVAGPIIRANNGFVDKYIGDAAMALFVNARDAVKAGIALYGKIVLDRKTRVKIGLDGITIGVGIHSGSVMMGIVGENERLSSTVISPNVNLASRVESLTKQTRSGMLITRNTLNEIAGVEDFNYRFIGMVRAAGVNEVVGLFDVLDALPSKTKKRRLATRQIFESGIRKYHTKNYEEARIRFEEVIAADPSDICAATCLEETRRRLADPNLPSVFEFEKK
ncbi:MAG: HAMP domain-containing protein [Treponema sp.]|jgi:class 3 adenylate cyclase/HAMP domain-containing protein|nr:HAMP domain-containing protein [Treponema sp.]